MFRFLRASRQGDVDSHIASMYLIGKNDFNMVADRGDLGIIKIIGKVLEVDSLGVQQDYDEAIRLYKFATFRGHFQTDKRLGRLRKTGHGIEQHLYEAARLFELDVEFGNARSQSSLGLMYEKGLGVEKSLPEAIRLYSLAAEQGYSFARKHLKRAKRTHAANLNRERAIRALATFVKRVKNKFLFDVPHQKKL